MLTIDTSSPGDQPDQINGLITNTKHWRWLEQNAETGMAVLFGVLDNMEPGKLDTLEGTMVSSRVSGGKSVWGGSQIEKKKPLGRVLRKFLESTEAYDVLSHASNRPLPDILFMDEAEFNQQMAKYEVT
jgi:hypothetical protein